MSTTIDDLKVTLSLDSTNFVISASQAGKVVRSLTAQIDSLGKGVSSIDRSLNSFTAGFRKFVITLGALRFIMMDIQDVFISLPASIIKSSGEVERMTKLMEGLSTQTSDAAKKLEATKNTKFVFDLALAAPFEVKAVQDAFVKLKTAGIDPTNGSLQALIDSVAKFGGTSEQLKRASIAIQQMGGKGVISMEELRQQLGEAVPNAIKLMAVGMGLSMSDLVKKISKGTVEAKSALGKMFLAMRLENQGAAKDMMDTWVGLTEQLKTRWTLFSNQVGQSGFLTATKDAVAQLNKALSDPAMVVTAQNLGRALADITKNLADMVLWMVRNIETVKSLAAGFGLLVMAPKILGAISSAYDVLTGRAIAALAAQRLQQTGSAAVESARLANLATSAQAEAAASAARLTAANGVMRQLEAANVAHTARLLEIDRRYHVMKNGQWRDADANRFVSNTARNAIMVERTALQAQIIGNNAAIASNVALANSSRQNEHQALMTAKGFTTQAEAVVNAGTKFTALSGIMTGMRFIWTALGGWIGAITLALSIGIPLWMSWGNKGAEAIKRIRDAFDAGVVSKEDVKELETQIADKRKSLASLEADAAAVRKMRKDNPTARADSGNLASINRQIAQTRNELAKLDGQIGKIREQAQGNADNKVYGEIANEVATKAREFSKARAVVAVGFMEDAAKLEQNSKEALALEKKAMEERLKGDVDLLEFIVGRRQIAEEAARVGGSDAKKNLAAWQEQEDKVRQLIASSRKTFDTPNVNAKGTETTDRRSPFEKWIARHLERIVQLKADVSYFSKEIVTVQDIWDSAQLKVDALINGGAMKDKKNPELKPGERQRMIEAMFSEDSLEIARRGAKQLSDVLQSTSAEFDKAQENWDAASNVVGQQESITEKLFKKLSPFAEIIRKELNLTATQYDEFVRKISASAAKTDSLVIAQKLRDETKALQDANNLDTRERITDTANYAMKQKEAIVAHEIAQLRKSATENETHSIEIMRLETELASWLIEKREQLRLATRTPLQKMADEWVQLTDRLDAATANWVNSFVDTLVEGLAKGKLSFTDFTISILKDITKLMMQKVVGQFIQQIVGGFSWGGDAKNNLYQESYGSVSTNAMGGIMSPGGKLPLNSYASGGIAKSPQLAIFGEGRQNEAYVPLPDGKRIPVAMQGAQPSVTVNVINQSGQQVDAKQSTPRFDGKQMVLDVILTSANTPGPFRDSMRQAMR